MDGREYAGSHAGRAHILQAVRELKLQVPTTRLPLRIEGLLSIDHIAVPAGTAVQAAERVIAASQARRLSDHGAYVVTLQD